MGLDCYIPGTKSGGRIGSYSGVHELRKQFLTASLKYLKHHLRLNYTKIVSLLDPLRVCPKDKSVPRESSVDELTDDQIIKQLVPILEDDEAKNIIEEQDIILLAWIESYNIISSWQSDSRSAKPVIFGLLNYEPALNYDRMRSFDMDDEGRFLSIVGLIGLYKFCDHSDCEGIHTPGDCFDILTMIKNVRPFMDEDEKEWIDIITEYFQASVDERKPLIYC